MWPDKSVGIPVVGSCVCGSSYALGNDHDPGLTRTLHHYVRTPHYNTQVELCGCTIYTLAGPWVIP